MDNDSRPIVLESFGTSRFRTCQVGEAYSIMLGGTRVELKILEPCQIQSSNGILYARLISSTVLASGWWSQPCKIFTIKTCQDAELRWVTKSSTVPGRGATLMYIPPGIEFTPTCMFLNHGDRIQHHRGSITIVSND